MNTTEPYLLVINLVLSLTGFLALGLAYRHVQRKISTNDKGYKYLAFAILPWLISPAWRLSEIWWYGMSDNSWTTTKWISLYAFSTANNWILLRALPFFDHFPLLKWFPPHYFSLKTQDRPWVQLISATCVFLVLLTLGLFLFDNPYANLPDAILSAITVSLVGWTFILSFKHRNLTSFAYLSGFLMLFAAFAPFMAIGMQEQPIQAEFNAGSNAELNAKLNAELNRAQILILFSHISIIITSFAMILGWVIERIGFPVAANMRLRFDTVKTGELIVNITVDDRYANMDITFSQSRYLALLKFAVRKHCRNMGLEKGEYQENDPTRINEVIRNHKIRLDDANSGRTKNHRRGASDPIEVELLEKWPFFFQKTRIGHHLVLLKENISISKDLIENQLDASLFPSLQSPAKEIALIKEEFKQHCGK